MMKWLPARCIQTVCTWNAKLAIQCNVLTQQLDFAVRSIASSVVYSKCETLVLTRDLLPVSCVRL